MDNETANDSVLGRPQRFPPWLRKRIPAGGQGTMVRDVIEDLRLATVCSSAHCPNIGECFACGTATFMILGDVCTRHCGFCAVRHGVPQPLAEDEPRRVAEAAARMGLKYVVVTSVTRDDLSDGGAAQFARTIRALQQRGLTEVEALTPDFRGDGDAIERVALAKPAVYNHNMETVPRLYATVRPQAVYERSLSLLRSVHDRHADVLTKSGLMLGLGETHEETLQVMRDLRGAGCDLLTLGQYLRPSAEHLPVERFVPPEEFEEFRKEGAGLGFQAVAAGPFVRSSYKAQDFRQSAGRDRRTEDYAC